MSNDDFVPVDPGNLLDNDNKIYIESYIDDKGFFNLAFNLIFSKEINLASIKVNIVDGDRNSKNNYFSQILKVENPNNSILADNTDSESIIGKNDALFFFDSLSLVESEKNDAIIAKINVHLNNTELNKALDILEEKLSDEENKSEVLNDMGYLKSQMGLHDDAERDFVSALSLTSDLDILISNNLAISLFDQRKYNESLNILNKNVRCLS